MRIAIALLCACGASSKPAPSLPAQRPADLVITLVRAGGVQGGSTKVTIDGTGAQVDETAGRWRFDVTDAQRDALWGELRTAAMYVPKAASSSSAPDQQTADVTIDFGGTEYRTEDTSVYGEVLDLYSAARNTRLPETRPADLSVEVAVGGGIDFEGFAMTIEGHDGKYQDTHGKEIVSQVPDAALDTLWGTIRAADPATIATTRVNLLPDTKVREVTVSYGGKSYQFGGNQKVGDDDAARVQSIDDAIMKLAPPP